MPDAAPTSGALLGDRYELGDRIGTGGAAEVYRAYDRRLDRSVAVKLVRPGADAVAEQRFTEEARLLATLSHAGLVPIYDVGRQDGDDGRSYLVMRLVEGQTLAARIEAGPMPAAEVTELGAHLAGALAYVHSRGIVHRDVKPSNVLLDAEGHAFLADFGISRLLDAPHVTSTGIVIGTAAFLAPEQVRGAPAGPAADVYALGLVLIQCLTGRAEYSGGAVEAALARLHRPPIVPAGLASPLSEALSAMTAAEPDGRPAAGEIAAGLGNRRPETTLAPGPRVTWPEPPAAVPAVGFAAAGGDAGTATPGTAVPGAVTAEMPLAGSVPQSTGGAGGVLPAVELGGAGRRRSGVRPAALAFGGVVAAVAVGVALVGFTGDPTTDQRITRAPAPASGGASVKPTADQLNPAAPERSADGNRQGKKDKDPKKDPTPAPSGSQPSPSASTASPSPTPPADDDDEGGG